MREVIQEHTWMDRQVDLLQQARHKIDEQDRMIASLQRSHSTALAAVGSGVRSIEGNSSRSDRARREQLRRTFGHAGLPRGAAAYAAGFRQVHGRYVEASTAGSGSTAARQFDCLQAVYSQPMADWSAMSCRFTAAPSSSGLGQQRRHSSRSSTGTGNKKSRSHVSRRSAGRTKKDAGM